MKRKISYLLFVFSFGLLLTANTLFAGTLHVGVALPLSGDHGKKGTSMLRAVEMYFSDVNKHGGINGNKVELVVKDDANTAEGAAKAATEFASRADIVAVIGHYYSSALAAAAPIYEKAGIPVISPFASNGVIGKRKWLFSMNIGDVSQGQFMAVYLNRIVKRDNVIVIHTNEAFGEGLKRGFVEKADKIGLKVSKVVSFDQQAGFGEDFIAKQFPNPDENKKAQAIVLLTHSAAGMKLVKQIRTHGFTCDIMGPHTFASTAFLTDIDEEYTKDIHVTAPFLWELANEKAGEFHDAYQAKYKEEPDVVSPMAYDAALVLSTAIMEKGAKREDIQKYLVSLKWKTAVDGLTGNLYFAPGRTLDRNIYVTQIHNGRFKACYVQLEVPKEPYVYRQKEERLKKGYLIEADNVLYHVVDVVFVGVDFVRITNVNTVNMTFDGELFLWYKWMGDKVDINQFGIVNGVNVTSTTLLKEDLASPVKYKAFRLRVTFLNSYNFSRFPFDNQVLSMTIANRSKNSTHIMCAIDTKHMTHKAITDIHPPEWTFISKKNATGLYRFASTFGDPDYREGANYKSKIYFASANFSVLIKRIMLPYVFTFFIPMGMIMGILLLLCRITIDQFVLRLNLSMTSALSLLVYQMSQKASMPKVGYIMKADLYFVCSYVFILILVATLVTIQYMLSKDKKPLANKLNKIFAMTFIPALLISYIIVTLL